MALLNITKIFVRVVKGQFENKSVDVLVYRKRQCRLDMSTVVHSRKPIGYPLKIQSHTGKRARAECSSISRDPFSLSAVAKYQTVIMDDLSDDAQEPAADTDTALLEEGILNY